MRIAIIGGGSAGLVTAHLLDGTHDVTVLEKEAILGGHVRTLNRNVSCDLDDGLVLDAGVIEFEPHNFPTLMRLFVSLGCETRPVPGTTTFWTQDGEHHLSPGSVLRTQQSLVDRLLQLLELIPMGLRGARFRLRANLPESLLQDVTLGDLLTQSDADRWVALLATYAYSIPYDRVRSMPAALVVPVLRAFSNATGWVSLRGGSWDYLGRIVDRFGGTIATGVSVRRIMRNSGGVTVKMGTGEMLRFDKVVFAAPPDQTLQLLGDPTAAETRRFGAWRGNHMHTLVHDDTTLYTARGTDVMTEFDVIETGPNRGGYNCYLNELCGVPPDDPRKFGLAYGIDELIQPGRVLLRQEHHTPDYTVAAHQWHHEVAQTNGENHTYHVGAWLGDGLQEGAVTSALAVSSLLGGRSI